MKKKTQNILIIFAIVAFTFVGIITYGVYSIYTFLDRVFNPEIPGEIKNARVLKGSEFLVKTEFFKLQKKGFLETIADSSKEKDEKEREKVSQSMLAIGFFSFDDLQMFNDEVIAVGRFGAFIFDLDGKLKRKVLFEPTTEKIKIGWWEHDKNSMNFDNLTIVALEKDKLGFLSYGSVQGVVVFDSNGKHLWQYGRDDLDLSIIWKDRKEAVTKYDKSTHVLGAAVGDLNNDGIAEYVVARKNIGLQAFDRNGKRLWLQKDLFAADELLVIDLDGDGKNELVEIGSKVRNGEGKLIRELRSLGSTLLITEKDKKTELRSCRFDKNKLNCSDENDNTFFEGEAPLEEIKVTPKTFKLPDGTSHSYSPISIFAPKAIWVKLRKDKPKYLAIVGRFIGLRRANFYVYTNDGKLVYHELLPEGAETIAVLSEKDKDDSIIIAGSETIWKFAAK